MRKTKVRIGLHSSTEMVKYFICELLVRLFGFRICFIAIVVCHGSKTKIHVCTRLLLIPNLII